MANSADDWGKRSSDTWLRNNNIRDYWTLQVDFWKAFWRFCFSQIGDSNIQLDYKLAYLGVPIFFYIDTIHDFYDPSCKFSVNGSYYLYFYLSSSRQWICKQIIIFTWSEWQRGDRSTQRTGFRKQEQTFPVFVNYQARNIVLVIFAGVIANIKVKYLNL